MIGTKLTDKAGIWKSNDRWNFKISEELVYIENNSENLVLAAPDDEGKYSVVSKVFSIQVGKIYEHPSIFLFPLTNLDL